MKKLEYQQPQSEVLSVTSHLMGDPLLGSPTGISPVRRREPIAD